LRSEKRIFKKASKKRGQNCWFGEEINKGGVGGSHHLLGGPASKNLSERGKYKRKKTSGRDRPKVR